MHIDALTIARPLVFLYFEAGLPQIPDECPEILNEQTRMGLPRRSKIGIDAKVNLDDVAFEPHTTALLQLRRFRNLRKSEQPPVETTSSIFATGGHGQLNMIDFFNSHT